MLSVNPRPSTGRSVGEGTSNRSVTVNKVTPGRRVDDSRVTPDHSVPEFTNTVNTADNEDSISEVTFATAARNKRRKIDDDEYRRVDKFVCNKLFPKHKFINKALELRFEPDNVRSLYSWILENMGPPSSLQNEELCQWWEKKVSIWINLIMKRNASDRNASVKKQFFRK